MIRLNQAILAKWRALGPEFLPFADIATAELPFGRLLRLSLFQVSVGTAVVLLIGTLNRVMIVELGVPAWLVAVMVSLPLVLAPFRAVVGFRSDIHRSLLGWRRVPYLWMGTLLQFGGLAIMPFALIVLSGDSHGPGFIGKTGAAVAFLLLGAGLHTSQTAGLALATDLAPPQAHPRVIALMCVMLLAGMAVSALGFGVFLANFSEIRLIQVVQGAALATMCLNLLALWKQEPRNSSRSPAGAERVSFAVAWRQFIGERGSRRRLIAIGVGTLAFGMQDILLEPYGGQILHLSVGQTTSLTATLATGGLAGFAMAGWNLARGADAYRIAAIGTMAGLAAFSAVIFAAPLDSIALFAIGASLIGFGAGMFAVGTLSASMATALDGQSGLVIGAWGAVQATAAGVATALGGLIRDAVSGLAAQGYLGAALTDPSVGYSTVYHIEVALLFVTLIVLGPLVRSEHQHSRRDLSAVAIR